LVGVARRALPSLKAVGAALVVKALVAAGNSNVVVTSQVPTLLACAGVAGVHLGESTIGGVDASIKTAAKVVR
jgi:hypothetical protein